MDGPVASDAPRAAPVPCPECGQQFSRQGLPGHRRLKHGNAPGDAPLPELRDALTEICRVLERLEHRLARLDGTAASPEHELRRELERVLAEIARVQAEHDAVAGASDADRSRRRACHERLGCLRRHQVRLLYRLGPLAPGADPEAPLEAWELVD